MLKDCDIPEHVAIIMDGNGRWAKAKGRPRTYGHKKGSDVLKRICRDAYSLGIRYVTVYAFSTENWKRSPEEVGFLMDLLRQYLKESIKSAMENNMRVRMIGNRSALAVDIIQSIETLEEKTLNNTGLQLQIALNYGGRDEILRASRKIARDVLENRCDIESINEDLFSSSLDTAGIPDPELLIRTSGEERLSNYLLWQLAYAEFHFTKVFWPDFTKEHLVDALLHYNKKERRYGGVRDEN
nr:isoprenyl transferase [Anaerotalea alkaliphila]